MGLTATRIPMLLHALSGIDIMLVTKVMYVCLSENVRSKAHRIVEIGQLRERKKQWNKW